VLVTSTAGNIDLSDPSERSAAKLADRTAVGAVLVEIMRTVAVARTSLCANRTRCLMTSNTRKCAGLSMFSVKYKGLWLTFVAAPCSILAVCRRFKGTC
jgi:hypothetical protein